MVPSRKRRGLAAIQLWIAEFISSGLLKAEFAARLGVHPLLIDRWLRISRKRTLTDIFMSLIHTCRSSGANPFQYLLALTRNPEAVAAQSQRLAAAELSKACTTTIILPRGKNNRRCTEVGGSRGLPPSIVAQFQSE